MSQLKVITKAEIDKLINRRDGETKFGECIRVVTSSNWQEELMQCDAKFVLLGIPEDLGVCANGGIGGTHTLWNPALKAILNVQETELLSGKHLVILGSFDFTEWMEQSQGLNAKELRKLVAEVDEQVYPVVEAISKAGKIPIVIGGGHNNAYPILKGISKARGSEINCMNLDAHADYRTLEGRHSGNGFRYAKADGYLKKYAVVGLHRNYNSQLMLEEMKSDKDVQFCFYEDIFLQEQVNFLEAINDAVKFTSGSSTGIELDIDCIENILSSAATPSGLTMLQARQFVTTVAKSASVAYLHVSEGSVRLNDGREDHLVAKLVSYLITDFIRTASNKPTVFIEETEF